MVDVNYTTNLVEGVAAEVKGTSMTYVQRWFFEVL
jgi:hypothetical protein